MPGLPSTLPAARTPPPAAAPSLRWGVMAPGEIANDFVGALQHQTTQRVVAAGSRSLERAQAFCAAHQLERAYGSYEELASDPEVDVVYVATVNSGHRSLALLAIEAGKAVLVEKPFMCTAGEAREVAAAARARGVLCMEGMWSRYLPQTDVMWQILEAGVLGDVHYLAADHSQWLPRDGRLFKPELGGGALLDLGVYPVAFAFSVLGRPDHVHAHGTLTDTGLDSQAVLALQYASGAVAAVTTSMLARMPTGAAVGGTEATLQFDEPFYQPRGFTLSRSRLQGGGSVRWQDETGIGVPDGLCYQAAALARYVAEGRTESPLLGLDESIAIMETLDEARHQLGAYLPGEGRGQEVSQHAG
ncbi:MAG: Gfo/Idh/MocA family oxidoreductase [Candidatus Dormibacteraeota bacterium]|nr:Gfo/Idh/MocA family oxidoreductase [Candidatus Dormibacteraeota bacterium]